jgi:hypothetical protein
MTTKEAKDLQVGDVQVHAGMVRYKVIAVTPIGNGGYVEVKCEQVGKPYNVSVATMPAHTQVQVLT